MKSAAAITFDVAPSRRLEIMLVALAGVAMVAVTLSGLPYADVVRGLVFIGAIVVGARYRRAGTWRVAWRDDGSWSVADAQSVVSEAALVGWNRIGHSVVLRLRLGAKRRLTLIVLPDNVDADTRRRLVVRLARGDAAAAQADMSLLP